MARTTLFTGTLARGRDYGSAYHLYIPTFTSEYFYSDTCIYPYLVIYPEEGMDILDFDNYNFYLNNDMVNYGIIYNQENYNISTENGLLIESTYIFEEEGEYCPTFTGGNLEVGSTVTFEVEEKVQKQVNKVIYDGNTLIDITDTTAVESDVAEGKTFYKADGKKAVGINTGGSFEIKDATALFYNGARLNEYSKYMNAISESENTSTDSMFYKCDNLTSLDLSNFDTSNVLNMTYMFNGCRSLTSLDLSNFDTSNVSNMNCMFQNCTSLTSLDLSSFNTSNVVSSTYMFNGCSSLTSLDLSNFDTSNVLNMTYMFGACISLKSVKIGKNDTSYASVTSTNNLFSNAKELESIIINGVDILPITNANAFTGLKSTCQIKVPASLVNSYKTATNWSTRASYISAI